MADRATTVSTLSLRAEGSELYSTYQAQPQVRQVPLTSTGGQGQQQMPNRVLLESQPPKPLTLTAQYYSGDKIQELAQAQYLRFLSEAASLGPKP